MNKSMGFSGRKLKTVFLVTALGVLSHNAQADEMQNLYDDGSTLLTEFRKCSVIPNQFSEQTSACLSNSEKLINQKTRQFEQKYKVKILQHSNPANHLVDRMNFVQTQKNNCTKIYPEALRKHFKNQIKSCQVQVDLNRYFYITNTVFSY